MTKFHLNKELREKERGRLADSISDNGKLNLDNLPSVTRDEALELMVHHLLLAEIYYQATPDDEIAVLREVERLMAGGITNYVPPSLLGARAWLATLNLFYSNLAKQDNQG